MSTVSQSSTGRNWVKMSILSFWRASCFFFYLITEVKDNIPWLKFYIIWFCLLIWILMDQIIWRIHILNLLTWSNCTLELLGLVHFRMVVATFGLFNLILNVFFLLFLQIFLCNSWKTKYINLGSRCWLVRINKFLRQWIVSLLIKVLRDNTARNKIFIELRLFRIDNPSLERIDGRWYWPILVFSKLLPSNSL